MAAEQPSWLKDDPENPSAQQADNPFEVQFSYSSEQLHDLKQPSLTS